jgi:hypothetical protein
VFLLADLASKQSPQAGSGPFGQVFIRIAPLKQGRWASCSRVVSIRNLSHVISNNGVETSGPPIGKRRYHLLGTLSARTQFRRRSI